jgi:hypothetical protein
MCLARMDGPAREAHLLLRAAREPSHAAARPPNRGKISRRDRDETSHTDLEGRCSIQLSYGRVLGLSLFRGRAAASEYPCLP